MITEDRTGAQRKCQTKKFESGHPKSREQVRIEDGTRESSLSGEMSGKESY